MYVTGFSPSLCTSLKHFLFEGMRAVLGLASALFKECQNLCQKKVRKVNAYMLPDH